MKWQNATSVVEDGFGLLTVTLYTPRGDNCVVSWVDSSSKALL